MNKNDWAFPSDEKSDNGEHYMSHNGMTYRQWLIGQTLPAVIAAACTSEHNPIKNNEKLYLLFDRWSKMAIALADETIDQLSKET